MGPGTTPVFPMSRFQVATGPLACHLLDPRLGGWGPSMGLGTLCFGHRSSHLLCKWPLPRGNGVQEEPSPALGHFMNKNNGHLSVFMESVLGLS